MATDKCNEYKPKDSEKQCSLNTSDKKCEIVDKANNSNVLKLTFSISLLLLFI